MSLLYTPLLQLSCDDCLEDHKETGLSELLRCMQDEVCDLQFTIHINSAALYIYLS